MSQHPLSLPREATALSGSGSVLDRRTLAMPHTERGMAVGLFGGSFNPPHPGHLLVAEIAMRRLGLDRLWWIVTPGNPLKDHGALRPLDERVAACRALVRDPRIDVTAFEAGHRIRYTADTLALIARKRPGVRFVWIMGADGLASFHRWQDWRSIAGRYPIAVVDRPGSTLSMLSSPMAKTFARVRLGEEEARALARRRPPAWVFLHGPRSALSSSAIRAVENPGLGRAHGDPGTARPRFEESERAGGNKGGSSAIKAMPRRRLETDTEASLSSSPARHSSTPDLQKGTTTLRPATQPEDAALSAPSDAPASELARGRPLVDIVLASLEDSKGEDILSIDLQGKSALADYMVIVSGRSNRHVAAVAEHLLRDLKDNGAGSCKVEGLQNGDWVLIDAGDIIVHIFRPEVRSFYNIEKMWSVGDAGDATVH